MNADRRSSLVAALVPWLAATLLPSCSGPTPAPSTTTTMRVGEHELHVEIAATPEARELGLMFRRELPEDHGMLFVFPRDVSAAFWMKNTFLPLSIAYVDASGTVDSVYDMEPFDEDASRYASRAPVRSALEVSRGWFEAHGVGPGSQCAIALPPEVVVR